MIRRAFGNSGAIARFIGIAAADFAFQHRAELVGLIAIARHVLEASEIVEAFKAKAMRFADFLCSLEAKLCA